MNRQNLGAQSNHPFSTPYPQPSQDQPPQDSYQQQPGESRPKSGFIYEDQPPIMSGTPSSYDSDYGNLPPESNDRGYFK